MPSGGLTVGIARFVSNQRRYIAPLCLLFAALSPGLVAGCGSPGVSICSDFCDCEGCSDAAYDSCVATYDDNEKVSGDIGCDEPSGEYWACVADRGRCVGTDYETGGCEVERDRFFNCLKTAKCGVDGEGRIRCS